MSPLRPAEFVVALIVMSLVRLTIDVVPVTLMSIAFFGSKDRISNHLESRDLQPLNPFRNSLLGLLNNSCSVFVSDSIACVRPERVPLRREQFATRDLIIEMQMLVFVIDYSRETSRIDR
jgi:hypothetical protein